MAILPILRWPDPRLSRPAQAISRITPEIRSLAADMLETMYAAPGRGLAGPQVGAMLRIFVMDTVWKESERCPFVILNPEATPASTELLTRAEGCLSLPGIMAEVTRPALVDLRWTDLDGQPRTQRFHDFAAACVQHEIDHLDGIVTLDHLSPHARARAEAEYIP